MKKTGLFSLAAVLILTLLVSACSSNGGNSNGDNSGSKGNKEKVKLTFTLWGDVNSGASEQQLADEFNAAHPDIEVKFEPVPGDGYGTKLTASLAGGTAPDVFLIGEGDFRSYVDKGVVEPLDEYISKDSGFDIDIFQKSLIQMGNFNDKQYYLPKDFNPLAMWYNKKLFDEAKVEYPNADWTWDDLTQAAQKMTKQEKGKYTQFGFNAGTWEYPIYTYLWANGTDIGNEDGTKAEGFMNSDKTIAAMEKYVALSKGENRVSPTPQDTETMGGDSSMFMTGKLAMMVTGRWVKSDLDKSDVEYGSAMIPKGADGERAGIIAAAGWAVNSKGKHKQEAYELAKWLSGTEAQKLRSADGQILPATVKELDEVKAAEQNDKAIIEMMDYARLPVTMRSSNGSLFREQFTQALEKVLLGRQDMKAALDEAAKNVDAKLK
ncbi:ABC transporter substrate-binding protein [Paenibacillus nasutitermitis]|uniref:Sugar ABC transporter substrate-binding protein n=1 Tax=Paenibacillus nasutitermitis TaxID=1652958 RepID=A0A916Z7V9_9BACL|nr:sugar ABC transporter substrate-binding protein [Paenibacillus nasutitermitis]GGD80540.1 sugar ABC transporter substrate-binding protein [Paenibacillus nasutitermitis]